MIHYRTTAAHARDDAAMHALIYGPIPAAFLDDECFGCGRTGPTEHHDWDRNPICAKCAAILDGDR